MSNRSKSSHRWLQEHEEDHYVNRARIEGYRSRGAFKLMEIQEKDRLIRKGMTVVDLGAAPGGWCEIVTKCLAGTGRVIALDVLPMKAITDVEFIQGDFTEQGVFDEMMQTLHDKKVDLVISDMAPNITGIAATDDARGIYLAELALDFAQRALKDGGTFLVKVFHGQGYDAYIRDVRKHFEKVTVRKPKSSRARSKEVYVLAKSLKPAKDRNIESSR